MWPHSKQGVHCIMDLDSVCYRDIYALCEAFPVSYAERLYSETEKYLRTLVHDICEVKCIYIQCGLR